MFVYHLFHSPLHPPEASHSTFTYFTFTFQTILLLSLLNSFCSPPSSQWIASPITAFYFSDFHFLITTFTFISPSCKPALSLWWVGAPFLWFSCSLSLSQTLYVYWLNFLFSLSLFNHWKILFIIYFTHLFIHLKPLTALSLISLSLI